ncbi:deoxyribose-phosphate aldolase [candidate division KSB1 bacterium]|nr:deoxyribose-phosphate aldolase [candidate division KSB1 bacterium]
MDKILNISKYIDHTLLKPEATSANIEKLCQEALTYGFAAVCVNPVYVKYAHSLLINSEVAVCTVVGFPLGANTKQTKSNEARDALKDGATEIDMVIQIGALKSGEYTTVEDDVRAVISTCREFGAICKTIIETALLTDREKQKACELAAKSGANFVKTSTGFASAGATEHDVVLMSSAVKRYSTGVKAAGGIRSYEDAVKMINAGATRIGTSSGVKIVTESKES